MSKLLFGLGLVICLLSCKKKLEDLTQSFGNQNRARREVHTYTYDQDGRILTDQQMTYYLLRGEITDTTKTVSEYTYEKGKLIKITTDKSIPELTFSKIFIYNRNDSLILELWIEPNGDTTYISKTDYDERGNKILEKSRKLWDKRTLDEMIKEPNNCLRYIFHMERA